MDIELKNKKIQSIELKSLVKNEVEQDEELHMNIACEIYRHQSNKKMVRIKYPVTLIIQDKVSISLEYDFYFNSDKEITKDFNTSEAAKKIAPSMAYPYIKSYIENLLTLSGYKDFEIPFIDFNKEPFEF